MRNTWAQAKTEMRSAMGARQRGQVVSSGRAAQAAHRHRCRHGIKSVLFSASCDTEWGEGRGGEKRGGEGEGEVTRVSEK
jgi:hypothetical protein